ncbi:LacI family DNA-binding transcriptional regulator [Butyricicoccus porcorum]|uniref:LacI family transcriptional regulator n=1 Tax=Butyricicoccus porcorum TaxID=1945634 RepID=A0A252F1D7_9FIRM|nr:LacI family DNA-binding transcriptional regulator [Butyricicoccus porcorum]OUM19608.1 LacI family transcriptional regulator [Butyricicoccus porcorum]
MSVTIKDVAAYAGVSPSTVSRTCNDHPSISAETKKRVRQAMLELGYEAAPPTGNHSRQELKNIGIILPPSAREVYENSFYLETIRGITQFCNARQYSASVITGQNDDETLAAIHFAAQNDKVDGFILLYSRQDDKIVDALYDEGLLYVLIGKPQKYANQTICVDNDNVLAGQEATEYLYQLGHRRIAYLGSDTSLAFSADRKAGYQTALLRHDIMPDPTLCIEMSCLSQETEQNIAAMLSHPDRPTAIVASDDILATTFLCLCSKLGYSIPQDISVVAFNNSLFSRLTLPPLTTMDINSLQLGIEAASQLINHIENPNLAATKIIVPHYLLKRNSCMQWHTTQRASDNEN